MTMTITEAKLAFLEAQRVYLEAKQQKADAYETYCEAQRIDRDAKAEQKRLRYQTPRKGEPLAQPVETAEERTERIINEQHEKNLQLEREGKW